MQIPFWLRPVIMGGAGILATFGFVPEGFGEQLADAVNAAGGAVLTVWGLVAGVRNWRAQQKAA